MAVALRILVTISLNMHAIKLNIYGEADR